MPKGWRSTRSPWACRMTWKSPLPKAPLWYAWAQRFLANATRRRIPPFTPPSTTMRITFLGGGNMATALIGGLREKGFSAAAIQVVEPNPEARDRLTEKFGVRCAETVDAAALNCEALVLAVKPQQMREALAPVAGQLKRQLVISIAAGLRMNDIARWLGDYPRIVRTMPNTPALIGAGITGLYAAPEVDAEQR